MLAYQRVLETERAGYLIRQWVASNLYDRIRCVPSSGAGISGQAAECLPRVNNGTARARSFPSSRSDGSHTSSSPDSAMHGNET